MINSKYILWERRRGMPQPGIAVQVLMSLAIIAFSALTALAPGLIGVFFTGLSGAFFAFLLCTAKKPFYWLTAPLSYAAAFAIMGDPLTALSVLLYLLFGVILAYAVFTNRSLSVTSVALTVAAAVSTAVFLTIAVTNMYGEGIKESYIALYNEFSTLFKEVFSLIKYPSSDGEMYTIPEETVTALLDQTIMLIPCVCVINCELIGYGCAKLFRLFTVMFGFNVFFSNRRWAVTLSAPAGSILIVSLIISMFSREASVIAYTAINLAYILIPPAAIAGFHSIFGKGGLFFRQTQLSGRVMMIVACAFMGMISPFYFAQMLALIGSFSAVGKAIAAAVKKHRDDSRPD